MRESDRMRLSEMASLESGGLCDVRGAMFGLPGSGPHISRIERRRGSLATMGKARLVADWRKAAAGAAALVGGDENSAGWREAIETGGVRGRLSWERRQDDDDCRARGARGRSVGTWCDEQNGELFGAPSGQRRWPGS